MKYTLKDYQEEAVEEVLRNLKKASMRWHDEGDKHAFSLAATTGAGKTVMAAAAFEALFYGDDKYDFEADKTAVVIWFSDDPSLNEQTRFRLMEASDRLNFLDFVVVQNTFAEDSLSPGKIYFLNTQKLSKNSLLVRGHDSKESGATDIFTMVRPDLRGSTIWDTITNTIENPNLTLYLVLDEAHRGMGKNSDKDLKDKSTIVKRLINGSGSVPAIPIVLGISATVERFNEAMKGSRNRSLLQNVVVDSKKVQNSGLLKDTIVLEIPEKVGKLDKVLLARATEKLKDLDSAWNAYAELEKDTERVKPLMVLQVPNTPNHSDIGAAMDVMLKAWDLLKPHSFAHVFGERKSQDFGPYEVPHISPERVQETPMIRVLIAKDAISTGWDCPRAEVMVSFRPAVDRDHITQLLGRMIRAPLARRIEGNERLNSVHCLLPFFDTKTVEEVAEKLIEGGEDGGGPLTGRKVLVDSIELLPNEKVPEECWNKYSSLPSQTLPKNSTKPIKRLTAFAHELASDELLKDAGKIAHSELHKILDAAQARYVDKIKEARKKALTVGGISLRVDMESKSKTFDEFLEDADITAIEETFKKAGRLLSSDLTRTYAEYLSKKYKGLDSEEEALIEAHVEVAALSLVEDVIEFVEHQADKLTYKWFDEYRVDIRGLSAERQEVYRNIKAWTQVPQDVEMIKPSSWMVATTQVSKEGEKSALPRYKNHMMIDPTDGMFPSDFTSWEVDVIEKECSRKGFVCWYRNPSHPGHDSLGIPYLTNDNTYAMVRPDFIFFSKNEKGEISIDVIDPHATYLDDALPKLDGLALYAQKFKTLFRRFESVAKVDNKYRVLDLLDELVCKAIPESNDPDELFRSDFANDYK